MWSSGRLYAVLCNVGGGNAESAEEETHKGCQSHTARGPHALLLAGDTYQSGFIPALTRHGSIAASLRLTSSEDRICFAPSRRLFVFRDNPRPTPPFFSQPCYWLQNAMAVTQRTTPAGGSSPRGKRGEVFGDVGRGNFGRFI